MNESRVFRTSIPTIYGVLLILALIYLFRMAEVDAFCGLPDILLTAPWSLLLVGVVAVIAPEIFEHSLIPGVALISISGMVWLSLLWWLGRALDRFRGSQKKGDN